MNALLIGIVDHIPARVLMLIGVFGILFFIELILLLLAKRRNLSLQMPYFIWHDKYGLMRATLIKLLLASFMFYSMQQHMGGHFIEGILFFYGINILILGFYLVTQMLRKQA